MTVQIEASASSGVSSGSAFADEAAVARRCVGETVRRFGRLWATLSGLLVCSAAARV